MILNWLYLFTVGIVAHKAKNKGQKNTKINARGMLSVKGIDIEDDEPHGIELRSSEYKSKKEKKGCKCWYQIDLMYKP